MRYILAIVASLVTTQAFASPIGEWVVQDRTARILIRSCGHDLCGKLSWSSDGKDVGRAILIAMKPDGERWSGTVVDVRDNTRYAAHLSLESEKTLKLDGCVLGGLVCNGETWTRYK